MLSIRTVRRFFEIHQNESLPTPLLGVCATIVSSTLCIEAGTSSHLDFCVYCRPEDETDCNMINDQTFEESITASLRTWSGHNVIVEPAAQERATRCTLYYNSMTSSHE